VKDEQPPPQANVSGAKSMDSINSYEGGRLGLIMDGEQVEDEEVEKARLISQVLELQNTLDDLNQRVDAVKFENLKLKSENQVLGQYIGE
jgi:short coiled-coil protein